jgi:hypothetical protein
MIKRNSVVIAMLLIVYFAIVPKQALAINFIGYDGQSPIFASIDWDGGGKALGHDGIYKYANGRLTRMNVSIRKGTWCYKAKDEVYVFSYGDSLYYPTMLQFKRNGREVFFEQIVTWPAYVHADRMTMNSEELFVIADLSRDSSTIFRIKYRNHAKIGTIKIKDRCVMLLGATDDYLYYIIEYHGDDDDIVSFGSVYQMSLSDGSCKEILKNVDADDARCTGIVPQLNIAYFRNTLIDYNQNNRILSQNTNDNAVVFFSYEHNAFVDYKTSSNLSDWDCYRLAPDGKLPAELRAVPCFKEINGTK